MILKSIISQSNSTPEPIPNLAVDVSTLSIDQMTYPHIYKSSEWNLFTTTKDYFTIYSTDHEVAANGEIWWGEMDDPFFNGFEERARITTTGDGYQPESPFLYYVPTAKSGLSSDTYFLIYHTVNADPRNSPAAQESHLMTTSGGNTPDLCTWTDRTDDNGDNVFHLEIGETHTGYGRVWEKADGTYIAYHSTYAAANPINNKSCFSTSTDGINWTRTSNEVDAVVTFPLPSGTTRQYGRLDILPFNHNNTLYAIVHSNKYVSLCIIDPDTYVPQIFLYDIFYKGDDYFQQVIYYENGNLYIQIRTTAVPTYVGDWYIFKYIM